VLTKSAIKLRLINTALCGKWEQWLWEKKEIKQLAKLNMHNVYPFTAQFYKTQQETKDWAVPTPLDTGVKSGAPKG
jgi:hypothetical protein